MRLNKLLLITLLSLAPAMLAHADHGRRDDDSREEHGHRHGDGGKDAIARRAQRINGGGRVLAVDPVNEGYRVKLLKNGDVRVVVVPRE